MAVSGQFAGSYASCRSQTATCKSRLQAGVSTMLARKADCDFTTRKNCEFTKLAGIPAS